MFIFKMRSCHPIQKTYGWVSVKSSRLKTQHRPPEKKSEISHYNLRDDWLLCNQNLHAACIFKCTSNTFYWWHNYFSVYSQCFLYCILFLYSFYCFAHNAQIFKVKIHSINLHYCKIIKHEISSLNIFA